MHANKLKMCLVHNFFFFLRVLYTLSTRVSLYDWGQREDAKCLFVQAVRRRKNIYDGINWICLVLEAINRRRQICVYLIKVVYRQIW